jgi:hypothetical protein
VAERGERVVRDDGVALAREADVGLRMSLRARGVEQHVDEFLPLVECGRREREERLARCASSTPALARTTRKFSGSASMYPSARAAVQ